ncbi:MAG: hypothetical protein WD009_03135 [Phycisphaeraceae bacterium]
MASRARDINQKVLELNEDTNWYGSIAEIGGGQETGRWFFRVGRASGTVAKTMSAYDMTFSDAIYGRSTRYVSRQRLIQMLDHEFGLLLERLSGIGGGKRFFAFANTVATRSHLTGDPGRGWLGVRFQHAPGGEASQIILHAQFHDWDNLHQQEALGVLGINLIHGAYGLFEDPEALIDALVDNLRPGRVEVDMIHFDGPVAQRIDNRVMSLRLVSRGLTDATMFTAGGRPVQPAEQLYDQPVLVQRGAFHPITLPVVHMLEQAERHVRDESDGPCEPVVVTEMNLPELERDKATDQAALLERMEILQQLGRNVLISNFREHFRLTQLICRYTKRRVGLVMGAATLPALFDPRYYEDLPGGVLEAIGRLFKRNVRFYVYPYRDRSGRLIDVQGVEVAGHAAQLYRYLLATGAVQGLEPDPRSDLAVFPEDVRRMIREGEAGWEALVPEVVAAALRGAGATKR